MDIRLGPLQPDSRRDSDPASRKKRVKTKTPHEEEIWSERSDYVEPEEIEDIYIPSAKPEDAGD